MSHVPTFQEDSQWQLEADYSISTVGVIYRSPCHAIESPKTDRCARELCFHKGMIRLSIHMSKDQLGEEINREGGPWEDLEGDKSGNCSNPNARHQFRWA